MAPELRRPLDGIRVVELARYVAGPNGGLLLSDLGADVIKIESPGGEPNRRRYGDAAQFSPGFFVVNRGKRSAELDLKSPAGKTAFLRLLDSADVLLTSLRPDARERLGVDYWTLSSSHPRLVYCSVSAFGDQGQGSGKPAFDTTVQARSGLLSVATNEFDGPMTMAAYIPDGITGVYAAMGIVSALVSRHRTGRGQFLEATMLGCSVALLTPNLARWHEDVRQGREHRPDARRSNGFIFRASDGKPFALHIAPTPEKMWRDLTKALNAEHLQSDPRFLTNGLREDHHVELQGILRARFSTRPRAEWLELLDRFDVAVSPVNTLAEVFDDPYVKSLGLLQSSVLDDGDEVNVVGCPVHVGPVSTSARRAPYAGEHTTDVLRDIGYSDKEISEITG